MKSFRSDPTLTYRIMKSAKKACHQNNIWWVTSTSVTTTSNWFSHIFPHLQPMHQFPPHSPPWLLARGNNEGVSLLICQLAYTAGLQLQKETRILRVEVCYWLSFSWARAQFKLQFPTPPHIHQKCVIIFSIYNNNIIASI